MANFKFTNEHSPSEVGKIVAMLRQPHLWTPTKKDYPTHGEWLEQLEAQIQIGEKRAMVAYSETHPIGVIIYQRHRTQPATLAIKNISVTSKYRNKGIATFLLRISELEAANHDFPGINKISVDTKVSNTKMIHFFIARGYEIEEITDLYGLGTGYDAVFAKSIANQDKL